MSVEIEERPAVAPPAGGDDVEGERHIASAAGRRFDGTVETLCGQIRRLSVRPRPKARRCEACVEALWFKLQLDQL